MIISVKRAVILHDLFMIALAWELAWISRYNFHLPYPEWQYSFITMPFIVLTQAAVLWYLHLYKGIWRFASLPDMWNIFRSAVIGVLAAVLVLFIIFRLQNIPRTVVVLYPMYLMFFLGAPRLGYRLWKDHGLNFQNTSKGPKVLILGAGRGGEMLIREMLRTGSYMPVGILDDDPKIKKAEIHGVKILGGIDQLVETVISHEVNHVIIAIPSASNEEMQRIMNLSNDIAVPVRTLPRLKDMLVGDNPLSNLKEVSIEDLLGREKIELDWKTLQEGIVNKTIMITGAGGSIGSELCEQITTLAPKHLIFYEQSEFNLYKLQQKFEKKYPAMKCTAILGDVCDYVKNEQVLNHYKPDLLFHAAAYKHVPMLEYQIREAMKNNVLGTKYLADAAAKCGVSKFIFISTDKAVNPVNILGKSKRLAEYYCEIKSSNSTTQFITVRFGNVLGSDGSVVPLFKQQIKSGGPVTVTHPEVTRFFMTIPEACQLILQASSMGKGGEIFVLDMGNTIRIAYLAEKMIQLSGKIPGLDIKIEYTGLRPGEKMYEELFYSNEERIKTSHKKIFLAKQAEIDTQRFNEFFEQLGSLCEKFNESELKHWVDELIPRVDPKQTNTTKTDQINVIPISQN